MKIFEKIIKRKSGKNPENFFAYCLVFFLAGLSVSGCVIPVGNEWVAAEPAGNECRVEKFDVEIDGETHEYVIFLPKSGQMSISHWGGCRYCRERDGAAVPVPTNPVRIERTRTITRTVHDTVTVIRTDTITVERHDTVFVEKNGKCSVKKPKKKSKK